MPDFQKGKIYKLWSPSENLVYYGSTVETLAQRLAKHKCSYKSYNNDNTKLYTTSYLVLDCEDYKMELVEEYPCNNRQQLLIKEGEYIKNNECVNKCVAGRTKIEYSRQYHKDNAEKESEYHKNWYVNNIEKRKEYLEITKEERKAKMREYREANKDKIAEQQKQYRENNIEKIRAYDIERNSSEEKKAKKAEYDKQYRELNKKQNKNINL